jgi:hypothetical protein
MRPKGRRVILATLALAAACCSCQAAYVTGVYWIEDDLYYLDLTLHNNEPGDAWPAIWVDIHPGAVDAQAPEGWQAGWSPCFVFWGANDEAHWLPPGQELSGLTFQTDVLGGFSGWYEYVIGFWAGEPDHWHGQFRPEYVPEPWLAGPLALALCAGWGALRRRR